MRIDIENKILIPFLLLIIIPTLMVGGVFYWNSNKLLIESQKNNMANDLTHVVHYLDNFALEVEEGNLSQEQAQNQALKYLTKSRKEAIMVYDQKKDLLLTGAEPQDRSNWTAQTSVWFEINESKINAYIHYPEWDWVIGISYDTKGFAYELLEMQKYTLLIALIGIIVAVELSILLAHNISRPIKNLAEVCDQIAQGNLENKMPLERTDEIGVLSRALHNMLERLKENSKKLEAMKKSNEDILRCIDIGIIAVNKEGSIIGINQAANNLMVDKYVVDENDQYVGELSTLLMENLHRTVTTEQPVHNLEWKIKDGQSTRYLVVTTGLLRSEDGSSNGAICSFSDITQRKKVEERIERVNRLVSLGELAAGLAHEIRNPLAGMKTSSQVLLNRLKDQTSNKNLIEGVLFEIDRLNMLIADLLNFAHPRPADRTYVNVVEIIKKALELTENELEKHNIKLEMSVETKDTMAYIDRNQMEQVFLNIIINAVKAMKEGGKLSIKVYKKEDSMFRKLKVAFSDTGVGIEHENISRIFDPFFTTDPGGTGLGLSVVHKLVTANDGDIEVTSKVNQGTTFIISLPWEEVHPLEEENSHH